MHSSPPLRPMSDVSRPMLGAGFVLGLLHPLMLSAAKAALSLTFVVVFPLCLVVLAKRGATRRQLKGAVALGLAAWVVGNCVAGGSARYAVASLMAAPLLLFVYLVYCVVIEYIVSDAGARGVCRKCGYDLRGTLDPRCPECGTPFSR